MGKLFLANKPIQLCDFFGGPEILSTKVICGKEVFMGLKLIIKMSWETRHSIPQKAEQTLEQHFEGVSC